MDHKLLADRLFPHINTTPEDIEARYPKRDLPEGAKVTRMGPSPTGFMHLGNLYGALVDERLAHQSKGVFYLRIEDTDRKREVEGGVQMISINLVLPNEDDPVIYRGPIIAETVKQFWSDVVWEDVDFLFVDMPPGTGDVPLTVFKSLPVDGIIVVTSPQDLVSMIVGKAVKMAKMMNIPVLGIVENYSYLECPDCGKHISVFGESHVDEVAAHYELPVLAKLPIDPKLAEAVDAGKIEDAKLPDALSGALSTVEGLL